MSRSAVALLLAFSIGFFLYRAALVAVPIGQYAGAPSMACPEGNVPRPAFDLLTGLPGGVVVSCANANGEVGVLWGPMEVSHVGGHWLRSALLGLAGGLLALVALSWGARRRPGAPQHPSEVASSA